jgi:hypothetical protein
VKQGLRASLGIFLNHFVRQAATRHTVRVIFERSVGGGRPGMTNHVGHRAR